MYSNHLCSYGPWLLSSLVYLVSKLKFDLKAKVLLFQMDLMDFFKYPPSSGIASCVGTAGTVM